MRKKSVNEIYAHTVDAMRELTENPHIIQKGGKHKGETDPLVLRSILAGYRDYLSGKIAELDAVIEVLEDE